MVIVIKDANIKMYFVVFGIHIYQFSKPDLHVLFFSEYVMQRKRNSGRFQLGRSDLVKQGLKLMMIDCINQ